MVSYQVRFRSSPSLYIPVFLLDIVVTGVGTMIEGIYEAQKQAESILDNDAYSGLVIIACTRIEEIEAHHVK